MNQIEENFDNQSLIEVDQDLAEFKSIVNDIAKNESVLALREHVQHIASSRYSHLMEVSYYTYKLCKKLNLDYISAARAAMLHDFYFYNWRNKGVEGQKKFHLMRHPRIALTNAAELFELNDLEKDAILKHMWPVTIVPPKYAEGFIITFVDKFCAAREFFTQFKTKKKIKEVRSSIESKEKTPTDENTDNNEDERKD